MRSIKEILSDLPDSDKERLYYAFEQALNNEYVEYMKGRFIGVNIDPNMSNLVIDQVAGAYSEGRIVNAYRVFNG